MNRTLVGFAALAAFAIVLLRSNPAAAQNNPPAKTSRSAGAADKALVDDLVAANRILAAEGIVDGYGHVSVRHDRDPNRFLLSRSVAPALVNVDDIVEYDLDCNPVEGKSVASYSERFIHCEIYKARPDVIAIVHHHAPAVIPFADTGVPLRPMWHLGNFVGQGIPVFEIRDVDGMTNMLVNSPLRGRGLAKTLGDKPAALMRGHGAVVVGQTVKAAVARSIYLVENATLQEQAMLLGGKIVFLAPEEVQKAEPADYERAWQMWKRKALGK
jgi:ribulose-5-phosphate 4-epimerase/fuculose-1-phosphate aldolase